MTKKTLLCYLGLWWAINLSAQDPFFAHFFNNRALFNPALVGEAGALSVRGLYKSQWPLAGATPYRTMAVVAEESMPCSMFDWGLNLMQDVEGDGLMRTFSGGMMLAGTPTLVTRHGAARAVHNLRIGLGLNWAQRRVDFNRLVFSDQLDPKYGLTDAAGNFNPTDFVPPDFPGSLWYFIPSVGIAYKGLFNDRSPYLGVFSMGYSVHNLYGLGDEGFFGHQESILRIGTTTTPRHTAFAEWEIIPYYSASNYFYFSVKPTVLWQKQGELSYAEAGLRFAFSRAFALGTYYHFSSRPPDGVNTNWLSINVETSVLLSRANRFNLGFSYSPNLSGLQNFTGVGGIMEVSIALLFASSPSCKLIGRADEVRYRNDIVCPTASLSRRSKLYDHLWYGHK